MLKQHEMLPVFLFLFFRVEFVLLIGCFWKVPFGLGFCAENLCLINCLSPKRSVSGPCFAWKQHRMLPVFLSCFLSG